jgi:hypothetical protein
MLKVIQWLLMLIGAGTVLSVAAAIGYLVVDDYMVRRRQQELETAELSATPPAAAPTPASS